MAEAAPRSYNQDYFGKWWEDGSATTMLNVFHKEGNDIFHFWGAELTTAESDPSQVHRAIDQWNPIFQMFDITPEG